MKVLIIFCLILSITLTAATPVGEDQQANLKQGRLNHIGTPCIGRPCTVNGHCSDCCNFPHVPLCSFHQCTCL